MKGQGNVFEGAKSSEPNLSPTWGEGVERVKVTNASTGKKGIMEDRNYFKMVQALPNSQQIPYFKN